MLEEHDGAEGTINLYCRIQFISHVSSGTDQLEITFERCLLQTL